MNLDSDKCSTPVISLLIGVLAGLITLTIFFIEIF